MSHKNEMTFKLNRQLLEDCFVLGQLDLCRLLLMNNAALPWFILVPETSATEVCDLASADQALLWEEVNTVAEYVRSNYPVDKLNIGAIGNMVSQLHVHVVGRRQDDYCWPGVVWGTSMDEFYTDAAVTTITQQTLAALPGLMPSER